MIFLSNSPATLWMTSKTVSVNWEKVKNNENKWPNNQQKRRKIFYLKQICKCVQNCRSLKFKFDVCHGEAANREKSLINLNVNFVRAWVIFALTGKIKFYFFCECMKNDVNLIAFKCQIGKMSMKNKIKLFCLFRIYFCFVRFD